MKGEDFQVWSQGLHFNRKHPLILVFFQ